MALRQSAQEDRRGPGCPQEHLMARPGHLLQRCPDAFDHRPAAVEAPVIGGLPLRVLPVDDIIRRCAEHGRDVEILWETASFIRLGHDGQEIW
jgi:hypothetical protein